MSLSFLTRATAGAALALATVFGTPQQADAYPVDCAILLCLAGGWPASAECSHARAVFIRRITPFPIEPPLQIWRCPMHVSAYDPAQPLAPGEAMVRLIAAVERANPEPLLSPAKAGLSAVSPAVLRQDAIRAELVSRYLQDAQYEGEPADVDISGPEFDFVRSIRVYHVQASQRQTRDDCDRSDASRLGSYTAQGQFGWTRSSVTALPAAFGHSERGWCDRFSYRAVFIDWRDHAGNYGYERVDY